MAINRSTEYPGRFDDPDASYPQGKFKNRSAAGVEDGSYIDEKWLNDQDGFLQALLHRAGVTPSGVPDTAINSDYFNAANAIWNGKNKSVGTTAELRALDAKVGLNVLRTGYYVSGDGGGAPYIVEERDGSPDDGGSVIFLDNGMQARLIHNGDFYIDQFGATGGGSDNIAAIQSTYDAAFAHGEFYRSDGNTRDFNQERVNTPTVYWGSKIYGLASELVINMGVATKCAQGCTIKALTSGMRMIRTVNWAERSTTAGIRGFYWDGGLIAGDNKAKSGLNIIRTLNGNGVSNLKISGCNWLGTDRTMAVTAESGASSIEVTDASGLQPYDVLFHETTGQIFTIEIVTGNILTVSGIAIAIDASETIKHISAGFQSSSAQEFPVYNLNVTRCGVGAVCATDELGRATASMTFFHPWFTWNDFGGMAWNFANDNRVVGGGIAGSTFASDLMCINTNETHFDQVHFEPSAFTADPDLGGSTANFNNMQTIPVILNLSGAGIGFNASKFAPNVTQCGFRRFMRNYADDCRINQLSLGGEDTAENPNRAGDYALVEQRESVGNVSIDDVLRSKSQYVDPFDVIINENGDIPDEKRFYILLKNLINKQSTGKTSVSIAGLCKFYGADSDQVLSEYRLTGESDYRFRVLADGSMKINPDGNPANNASLKSQGAGLWGAGAGTSLYVIGDYLQPMRFGNKRVWFDDSDIMRFKAGSNPSSDTDGVAIGSQS